MKFTNTSEAGFESTIINSLIDDAGYKAGNPNDYDRSHAIDLIKLTDFLKLTQPEIAENLNLSIESPKRTKFLHRLQGEIAKHGIINVLRKGVKHGPDTITLFYGSPSKQNVKARELFDQNIFSVTRQLRYSNSETQLALDMAIFINGLPIATFELKNKLTKQTVEDAVQQYKNDRDPKELLFQFGRCLVHFAVDDHEVRMCTHLKGKASWFLPFNKGYNDGAGNPPNPDGLATDYLWKEVLTRDRLTDIIENYAQVIEEKDEKTGKKKYKQIFPRYHQLTAVRKLLKHTSENGAGKRYLIQHSAGSGKSNSIAWLSHQLVGIERNNKAVFDSILVVTDRRILDKQIRDTIKSFAQVGSIVGHAERSGDLRRFISEGKKIIITTVQKFPFILSEIGNEHRQNKFAIIIDEAHSSQGGRTASKMNMALSGNVADTDDEESIEDKINELMESRKMLTNSSYFAFTATPKNKTLEIFGDPDPQPDGTVKHLPFHSYTMKQAIQEGFILDVLKNYTPVASFYRLIKAVEDEPLFDSKKAQKKLRKFVESNTHAIREKTEIMVDHFHTHVMGHRKIGGAARAMVITSGIDRAIEYFHAINHYLKYMNFPYRAIVAFSGEHEYGGQKVTEASLNSFPSNLIADKIAEDPYRFLVVADKFQTGYDEPLMHTMYVDKPLSGIKAVQTLSRLNRAHPKKYDTFVLDFYNDVDAIEKAFSNYYRTTILSEETDPNKLHDLQSDLDGYQVYSSEQIEHLIELYLNGAEREKLDPILDNCVAVYSNDLDEDGQVDFKGKAKAFIRTYGFLSSILPYNNTEWEKLSLFLNFLTPKLPTPKEDDHSLGILETIDMDSYRAEVQASISIRLADEDAELDAVPTSAGGRKPEPEMDQLSNIIKTFNDMFGNIEWKDKDKIRKMIAEEIPSKVAADTAYQNAMKNSDKHNARVEHDRALARVMVELIADHTELYKQFSDNPSFKKWLGDNIFGATYQSQSQNQSE
ncbi:type I restriction endonuclease subunit R [Legionella pneumophila]|uniref:type I restriction endonuclease subunit R n=7 Tax=Legionella pneumophila TaxID=446 RepID=UPI0007708BB9|nr:type I restriction endonuclease subunit R [Legionella pneumophila]PYB42249.1 type I restriction endonuclease subunit R [Legionella pneumophila]PYB60773.1 type I restriction endonuclease subunit R [Legionella pneumophila]TID59168.1 type I restriction endonuclease subunit R [Legionella pneumophila]TID64232.1 type I restriction endonuclease subunit R [Legionella pneumophila]TID74111.1 type I restriction endonuclease subunit R [Legionella pneumophila]